MKSTKAQLENDMRLLHSQLLENGYFLPLGEGKSVQRYHPMVKGVTWADKINGFPELWKMCVVESFVTLL
jgi:hypothetical protein